MVSSILRKIWSPMAHQAEIWCHLCRQSTLSSWVQLLEEPELGETCQHIRLTFQIQTLRQFPSSWWKSIIYRCERRHFRDTSSPSHKKIAIFRVGPASESLRIVLTIMAVQSEIHGGQKKSVILARKTKLYQNDYIYS